MRLLYTEVESTEHIVRLLYTEVQSTQHIVHLMYTKALASGVPGNSTFTAGFT